MLNLGATEDDCTIRALLTHTERRRLSRNESAMSAVFPALSSTSAILLE